MPHIYSGMPDLKFKSQEYAQYYILLQATIYLLHADWI